MNANKNYIYYKWSYKCFIILHNLFAFHLLQAYTIKGSLPVGLENATLASPQQMAEEASRKRELRLYKNRYESCL